MRTGTTVSLLKESAGIWARSIAVVQISEHGDIEGFVLGGNAIVATWLHAPGLWYVEASTPPSRTALYRDLAGDVEDHSIVPHMEPARRLEARADFLGLPWDWFVRRCTDLALAGIDGLVHPSSRLLSTEGLDAAVRYVAYLDSQQKLNT